MARYSIKGVEKVYQTTNMTYFLNERQILQLGLAEETSSI
jgi:hypothetical protein